MTNQINSRIVTYPSLIEKSENHTVVIIDATVEAVGDIGLFCQGCEKFYDIYLYREDINDLHWLEHITENADQVLLAKGSNVTIDTKVSTTFNLSPLEYFVEFDTN